MKSKMAKLLYQSGKTLKNVEFKDRRLISTYGETLYSASTNAVSEIANDITLFDDKVEKYSIYQPTPISIAHFIEFGRKASPESSYAFLKREVPVR